MTYKNFVIEWDGKVSRVVLNRPEKLNALTVDIFDEIPQAFEELGADDRIRVIILKGAGRAFSAGADFGASVKPSQRPNDAAHELLEGRDRLMRLMKIWDCPKPVIAQLHGYAIGWGSMLPLFCDLRYAAEDFKMFRTAGVTGAFVEEVWGWFIGITAAKELAFLPNRRFTARELLAAGLLNHVYSLEELEKNVEAAAAEIATSHPLFLKMQKLALNRLYEVRGFREYIYTCKDFDAMLHWSEIGRANFAKLRSEFGGDFRKLAAAQRQEDYWDTLLPTNNPG